MTDRSAEHRERGQMAGNETKARSAAT